MGDSDLLKKLEERAVDQEEGVFDRPRETAEVLRAAGAKVAALEAEVERLREESAARLREIRQWVDASKDIFAADHMLARHKAEAQRDRLRWALRYIEDAADPTEGYPSWLRLYCAQVLAMHLMDGPDRARAALAELEKGGDRG